MKEQDDLGVAPAEPVAGPTLQVLSAEDSASGLSAHVPNAEMRITLAFDAIADRAVEVFAFCKYSDIAERMARAIVRELGLPVLVIHSDATQPTRRFEMAKVETWDVIRSHVPRVRDTQGTTEGSGPKDGANSDPGEARPR